MEIQKENYLKLKEFTRQLGAAVFGVAELKEIKKNFILPKEVTDDLTFGVSFGVSLSRKILETVKDKPNQLYYFHYQRTNILIDTISLRISDFIQKEGFGAMPIPASQVSDWENQLGHISHREVAFYAGLGWRGKNNLLVNKGHGALLRFGAVLTDFPLSTDKPVENFCGECAICVELCPAGAISEKGFNKELCRQKLKEFMRTEKIGQMVCGVCVKACPPRKEVDSSE